MQHHEYQRPRQRHLPRQRNAARSIFILLLLVAALGALSFYLISLLFSTTNSGTSSFDAHTEALKLALKVQDYRQRNRSIGRNLGMGEIVLIGQDGKPVEYSSPIYEGEKASAAYDPNANHSERRTHDLFLLPQLKILQDNGALDRAQSVSILVFSQIYVCPPCRADMRGWWKDFKNAVSTQNAAKIQQPTIWELTGSYNPDRSGWPQWTVVVNEDDVEQVNVPFDK
jgi:hypothetical protein